MIVHGSEFDHLLGYGLGLFKSRNTRTCPSTLGRDRRRCSKEAAPVRYAYYEIWATQIVVS